MQVYLPEGTLLGTQENRELTATVAGLERAISSRRVVEGMATLCDEDLTLHVDLGGIPGVVPAEDMGVPVDHLLADGRGDIPRVELPMFAPDLSVQYDLQQHVAELVIEVLGAALVDGVDDLIGLL